MVLDSLFKVLKLSGNDAVVDAQVLVNSDHPVFAGHFPGQPVVPGVCTLQLIKELMERSLHQKLRLSAADNMKFLAVIDPTRNPELFISISLQKINLDFRVNATVFADDVTFFKLKAVFNSTSAGS